MSKANESAGGGGGGGGVSRASPPIFFLKARCDILHSGAFQSMIFASKKSFLECKFYHYDYVSFSYLS